MSVQYKVGHRLILLATLVLFSSLRLLAEDWPCWRGPRGDGSSLETSIPVVWDGESGKNIRWRVKLPASGHSSPVVAGDRVYITGCIEATKERCLLALDRATGRMIWQQTVVQSPLETRHKLNSYASGTPAVADGVIYVSFLVVDGSEVPAPNVGTPRPVTPGRILVAAFDKQGRKLWAVETGEFTSVHGFCTSPVVYEDSVIVNGDHDGASYVTALDRRTGKTLWKTMREHRTRSYCTPIIRRVRGADQMVLTGSKRVVSLNPQNGQLNWLVEGPTEQFVSSMVYDGSHFFLTAGFPTHHVMAIRPDGQGDVTDTHVVWHSEEAKCYVPSPVLCDRRLYVADDRGTASCFDTATGERLWRERLGNHFSGSLVATANMVLFTADNGQTTVIRSGLDFDVVSENQLGEFTYSSPALSGGTIFIRGEEHLFAIAVADAGD